MQNIKHYDIAIIGKGITGLSSAYALLDAGYKICFSDDPQLPSATEASAKALSGGFIDNFTRISQRHGAEKAREAWNYADCAFDATIAFAKAHDVPYKVGSRVRLIETEDERIESQKAVEQLQQLGFKSRFEEKLPEGGQSLLGQQLDAPRAAVIETSRLIETLSKRTERLPTFGRTEFLKKEKNHFVLRADSQTIHAEVVILACHLGVRDFLPNLTSAFVPSQDQWMRFPTLNGATLPFPVGSLLTWRHGHYWASVERPNQLCLGGARFLRPMAGFEAEAPELSAKVSKHLPEAWAKYFPQIPLGDPIEMSPGLDLRPSDEIPIIGPMFGEAGLFVAAGYMGQGLSLGFKAGQSLANIVLGKTDELPRFFWPERHRSLGADD